MKKNRVAKVYKNISDKKIYILDSIKTPDNKTMVYYKEYGSMANNIKTKVITENKKQIKKLKYACTLGFEKGTFCSLHNGEHDPDQKIVNKLNYLRKEIEEERISYGEIFELQSLAEYIDPGDTLLLEWAGVPENKA